MASFYDEYDYYGPKLVFHGGLCCGIKTIHGFYPSPNSLAAELQAVPRDDSDQLGHNVNSNQRFFTDAAPEEKMSERIDRYIAFVKEHRPQHIIEVVIAHFQLGMWKEFLRSRQFRKVTEAKNSNSGNTIYIYHKRIGQPPKKKKAATPVTNPFN